MSESAELTTKQIYDIVQGAKKDQYEVLYGDKEYGWDVIERVPINQNRVDAINKMKAVIAALDGLIPKEEEAEPKYTGKVFKLSHEDAMRLYSEEKEMNDES